MAMEMRLNLKMSQKLVMTPMLQQAIKLLPLARLELAQLVRQEITDNPVLEEILEEEIEEEEKPEKEFAQEEEPSPATDEPTPQEQEIDWDSFIQNSIDRGSSVSDYTELPSIETTYKKEPTLTDHLHWPMNFSRSFSTERSNCQCRWSVRGGSFL